MRFALSEDQAAIRDVVRDLLHDRFGPSRLRAAWEAEPGALQRDVWHHLVEVGVPQLLVPESSGGLGMDEVALVALFEETGRVGLPHPVVETAGVAAPLLARAVDAAASVPTGDMVGASWRGAAVACGTDVEWVLGVDDDAVRLHRSADVELVPLRTVDGGRRLAALDTGDDPGVVLTDDRLEVSRAFDRAALGVAAQLLGLADTMLSLTVQHVGERVQFGVPIGSFQAVKHHLADALMEVSFARPVVLQAAHALAVDDPGASQEVSRAKVLAAEAAELAGRQALQCHGAIGYTVEHDLHLFLKRAWALGRAWGDVGWHTERVAASLAL